MPPFAAVRTVVALLALLAVAGCARSVATGDGGSVVGDAPGEAGYGCIRLVATFAGDVVDPDAAPGTTWYVGATPPGGGPSTTCSVLGDRPYDMNVCGLAAPGWRGVAWIDTDPAHASMCFQLQPDPTAPAGFATFAMQPGTNPDLAIEIRTR